MSTSRLLSESPLADRTVLITGGAGFIGSHLADALVDHTDVSVLDDFSTGRRQRVPADATLLEADVRDRSAVVDAVRDADVVFHQAGLVSVAQSIQTPPASQSSNATGTLNVLEAAREHGARVVLASSAAIYGHPEYTPIDEEHPLEPTSPYGLDKLTADHYARLYYDLYDLETVALRYFNVYGPGQTGEYAGVISVFCEQARENEPITVHGDGTQTRDFVHVEDVVRANLLAATTEEGTGEAFNVGTGSSVTIRELAEIIRDVTGSDSEITHVDPRDGDIDHSRADVTRARSRLDYEPTLDLEEGLRRLVATR